MRGKSLPRAAATILALCATLVAGIPGAAARLPVPGVDPLPEVSVVENPDEALARWVERGVSGAVLIHASGYADLQPVAASDLAALRALRDRGDAAGMRQARVGAGPGRTTPANYVRAAAELGVVREVIWVVPLSFRGAVEPEALLQDHLSRAGFPAADRVAFARDEDCFRGRSSGVVVLVCGADALPVVGEPVLLDVSAGYLPAAASLRGVTVFTALRDLLTGLGRRREGVRDAVVSAGVEVGYLPVGLRWLADALAESLRSPALLQEKLPPERWRDLLRVWELTTSSDRHASMDALSAVARQLERYPDDPAFLTLAALAGARQPATRRVFDFAERACRLASGYCPVLPVIGLLLADRGELAAAGEFLASGLRLRPEMAYALLETGITLVHAGRLQEALEAFERFSARAGAYPGGFLSGATHLDLGDRVAARRAFDAAAAALAGDPAGGPARDEVAVAAGIAARFYREEGLLEQAARLEGDPRLRRLPPEMRSNTPPSPAPATTEEPAAPVAPGTTDAPAAGGGR